MTYRASLLGQPVMGGPEGNFHLASRKGQALLYYCLSQPGVFFSRTHLVSLFWENVEESQARKIFSTSLTRLRQSMTACPLLTVDDKVGFDCADDGWETDLQLFQKMAVGSSQSPKTPAVTDLEAAVDLWRGPFLDGFELPGHEQFEYWLQSMRVHWTQEVLSASRNLVEILRGQRAWEKAIFYAQKAIAIDSYQEVFHRFLMRTYAETGNRAVALAQYSKYQKLLAEELGVEPDGETRALHEAILRNDLPPEGTTAMVIPNTREVPLRSVAVAVRRTEPFVGREEDLAWLRGHLCRGGSERVLVLRGEAGVGKTRLVIEALEHFGEELDGGRDPIVLGGSFYKESQVFGYAPFMEMLRPLVVSLASNPAGSVAPWLTDLGGFFPDLLSGAASGSKPTREQHHFLAAVVSLLAFWQRRIILVLDDLQWADEGSLLLLAHLARSPQLENLIVVATMRFGEARTSTRRLLLRMESQGLVKQRRIGGLRPLDLRQLVTRQQWPEDEHLVGWLEHLTRGNALFVEEILHFIHRLGPEADVRPLLRRELPRELRTFVQVFLEELPKEVQELLSVLAIFHKSVPIPLIQRILDFSEETVVSSLETAVAFGLLEEVGRLDAGQAAHIPGLNHLEIAFRHELIRRGIRQEISRPRRRMLHRRVRDLLVREPNSFLLGTATTSLEETLVYHTLHGGLEAWNYPRNTATLDHPSLVFYLAEILAYLDQSSGDLAADEALVEARSRLDEMVSVHWGPMAEGYTPYTGEVGLRLATARAIHSLKVLNPEPERLSFLRSLTVGLNDFGGDLALACGLSLWGAFQANVGEYEEAWQSLEKALRLHRTLGNQPEIALTQAYLSVAAAGLGRFEQARSLLGSRTEEPANLKLEPAVPVLLAGIHHLAGEWAPALEAARQALEAAEEEERPLQEYLALSYCGLPLARLGDVASGIRTQSEAIALAERTGIRFLLAANHAWLAEMRLQSGLIDQAEEAASLALRLSPEGGRSWEADLARRVLGEIFLAKGHREAAEKLAAEALAGCEARGARPEGARCRAVLANSLPDERGGEQYQLAAALMNEMGLKWDLNRLRSGFAAGRQLLVGGDD